MLVLLAAALAGCGGQATHGTATLWVTRDRGAHVLLVRSVPAGETAMQALTRAVKLKTRYGGRYVQGINGVEGSLSARRDWFYFVNGVAPERGAAEVRLHPGDVEWWDYRSWGDGKEVPVVVGAFPEPFLHGGRPAIVVGSGPGRAAARGARPRPRRRDRPEGRERAEARRRARASRPRMDGGRVVFTLGTADAPRLAADATLARFRYEGLS